MKLDKVVSILQEHVPPAAVSYCVDLWNASPFELKLTKSRQTKVGDFTSRGTRSHPRITLNHDLNPYLFLMTYVHEVAHLRVYLERGNRVDPHGEEWKSAFTDLMVPLLWESVFPEEILHELRRHMINPRASSFADTHLTHAFRKFDKNVQAFMVLSDVPEGSIFLLPADAQVSDVQFSLL